MIWKYIKADSFFRDYLPEIKNVRHKIRGKNTRGNPLDFSDTEKEKIQSGLKKLFEHLNNPK